MERSYNMNFQRGDHVCILGTHDSLVYEIIDLVNPKSKLVVLRDLNVTKKPFSIIEEKLENLRFADDIEKNKALVNSYKILLNNKTIDELIHDFETRDLNFILEKLHVEIYNSSNLFHLILDELEEAKAFNNQALVNVLKKLKKKSGWIILNDDDE